MKLTPIISGVSQGGRRHRQLGDWGGTVIPSLTSLDTLIHGSGRRPLGGQTSTALRPGAARMGRPEAGRRDGGGGSSILPRRQVRSRPPLRLNAAATTAPPGRFHALTDAIRIALACLYGSEGVGGHRPSEMLAWDPPPSSQIFCP